ncbi:MAG: heparinase II/III family protein [Gammaproteobacteria bacterium]|nr:heparinase II/III family protein [Gammaproteobacteria bacterium]
MTYPPRVGALGGALISVLLAVVVFAAIWVPELGHWYVRPPVIASPVLDTARSEPSQRVLEEIAAMSLGVVEVAPAQVLAAAEQVMRGTLSLPGFPPAPITLGFSPEDLRRGPAAFQLMTASLASADLLLDAYRLTRRDEFFRQARDVIVGFAQYEARQWINHGMVWNDHAIAGRIPVLVKFWAEYRARPDFDPAIGRIVLDLAARSAKLLAKPSFYAWRTGHGIVSDLAILQVAAAFPALPEISELRDVAAERFRNHLGYWINQEGVALLHSAGYHGSALYFFSMALRLHTLNGLSIPQEWWSRHAKAAEFYTLLRRPDGTLPMVGDTRSTPDLAGRLLDVARGTDGAAQALVQRKPSPPTDGLAVYPAAGHAILWDGLSQAGSAPETAAQTAITWSYHPGLGHKIADELSMVLWAGGRTWVTNTGYWPYGEPGREQAESWGASNAPHLLGESKHSERTSRVRGVGQGKGVVLLDMERTGPEGYSVRRQIVRLAGDQSWVVLDHAAGPVGRVTTTNWTFYPDLSVTPLSAPGRYRIAASSDSPVSLVYSVSGSEGMATESVAGQTTPFAGWVVLDRTPTRAPAIVVRQPSPDSWTLASFSLVKADTARANPVGTRMDKWTDAEHWKVVLKTVSGEVTLTRDGPSVRVSRSGPPDADVAINLAGRDPLASDVTAVRESFRWASEHYHQFRELIFYRVRLSYLLLALLVGQELLLFLIRRRMARVAQTLRLASWVVWPLGGFWLSQVYLAVPP